ncbi:Holliday junction resolvase RuvX [Candidatus Peregrinibacteria bacterium]|nr:MAG: Holliday junction resolvase RuvX [Candidatus Peregrinibacteria bacterium]
MKIIGIDYGAKRIGIAVGDTEIGIAFPREILPNDEHVFDVLQQILVQEKIVIIVVGNPILPSGGETKETQVAQEFAEQCKIRFSQVSTLLWDERYSSRTAQKSAREMGHTSKTFRGNLDAASAAILLQSYLDSL